MIFSFVVSAVVVVVASVVVVALVVSLVESLVVSVVLSDADPLEEDEADVSEDPSDADVSEDSEDSEEEAAALGKRIPEAVVLPAPNRGYAAGNNLGFRYLTENYPVDYVLFSNNDIRSFNMS